eukprot:5574216-Pleurochrysis_carterae.AAC.2
MAYSVVCGWRLGDAQEAYKLADNGGSVADSGSERIGARARARSTGAVEPATQALAACHRAAERIACMYLATFGA